MDNDEVKIVMPLIERMTADEKSNEKKDNL